MERHFVTLTVILLLSLPHRDKATQFLVTGNNSNYDHNNNNGNINFYDYDNEEPQSRQQQRQQPACTYSHQFSNVGEFVWLKSENYPNHYLNNQRCRYSLFSPPGTQMTLECGPNDFNVESSTNCQFDMFYWSLNGDSNFGDRQFACGQGQISLKRSFSNRLEIGFKSNEGNPFSNVAFQYKCKITTVAGPCSCGVSGVNTRIVGGVNARIGEYPWRVALYTSDIGVFCGGTLISPNWVLTAAHCTNNVRGQRVLADIGDHDYTILGEVANEVIEIDRVIQNSWYNDKTQENDVSLLHLKTPVTFKQNIQPACLPWKFTSRTFDRDVATASGWGTDSFAGELSTVLKKVDLDVIGTQRCQQIYQGREGVTIANSMLCASRPGKDTCQSDSGGSLDYRDPSTGSYYAIGVVSNGIGCADPKNPGIYSQLIYFLGWIEQNTGDTFCKT